METSLFDHMFGTNLNSRSSTVLCSSVRAARLCRTAGGELGLDYRGFASRHRLRGRDSLAGAVRHWSLRHGPRLKPGRLLCHLVVPGVKVLLLENIEILDG